MDNFELENLPDYYGDADPATKNHLRFIRLENWINEVIPKLNLIERRKDNSITKEQLKFNIELVHSRIGETETEIIKEVDHKLTALSEKIDNVDHKFNNNITELNDRMDIAIADNITDSKKEKQSLLALLFNKIWRRK